MKKVAILLLICLFSYEVFNIFIKTTHFGKESIVFEYKKNGLSNLADTLVAKKIILDKPSFMLMAKLFNVEAKAKPGKYLVKKHMSLLSIIKMLRNNQQAAVNLVIKKVRTRAELSKLIQNTISIDSATANHFFNDNASLAPFGVDTTSLLTLMLPNTYKMYWSSSLPSLMQQMKTQKEKFWKSNDRLEKAKKIGLTPNEVYILASIVEEECYYDTDKQLVASVYLNRLTKGMPLQADPTVKYAMQDFTLTRIYSKYLTNPSPYNTYQHKGLPPGPICTPSIKTIDIVLNAPTTNYIYFVAKADFSGYHQFSTTYEEHIKFAKEYQLKLDEYQKKKKN
jgi:UPF0755 protein